MVGVGVAQARAAVAVAAAALAAHGAARGGRHVASTAVAAAATTEGDASASGATTWADAGVGAISGLTDSAHTHTDTHPSTFGIFRARNGKEPSPVLHRDRRTRTEHVRCLGC